MKGFIEISNQDGLQTVNVACIIMVKQASEHGTLVWLSDGSMLSTPEPYNVVTSKMAEATRE